MYTLISINNICDAGTNICHVVITCAIKIIDNVYNSYLPTCRYRYIHASRLPVSALSIN